jgi:polar amino acid transport system permease protein
MNRTSPVLTYESLPAPGLPVRGRRHPWRWIAGGAVLVLLALLLRAFAEGNIRWAIVGEFLTAPVILKGFVWTLLITFVALALGIVLGFAFGMMRLSANPVLRFAAQLYVWVFRGTPVLLQLLIWFNIALIFPTFYIPGVIDMKMVTLMTPFVAAVIGLGVNEGSYLTEVVRGQVEAANTLGMTPGQTMRRIILPQTMRLILPVLGNSAVGMLKFSSLAATIAMTEMLNAAQRIYFINGAVIELLFVCAIWYLAGTTVLSIGQYYLERHFGRSNGGRA